MLCSSMNNPLEELQGRDPSRGYLGVAVYANPLNCTCRL